MKILFLSYEVPLPTDAGDRIYVAGLLRELMRNNHEVHLVAFDSMVESSGSNFCQNDSELMRYAKRYTIVPFSQKSKVRAFFSRYPGMIANRYSKKYLKTIDKILAIEGPFDAIIVNHFKMAYVVDLLKNLDNKTQKILITHNVEKLFSLSISQHCKRNILKFAYFLDSLKMQLFEPYYLKKYNAVTAITDHDTQYFKQKYGIAKVNTIMAGIELSQYEAQWPDVNRDRTAIICGSFYWEPHQLNLLSFLESPNFHKFAANGISIKIVGGSDPGFIQKVNNTFPMVKMLGYVKDVRPHYNGCSIVLIPELMGGGFKLKVLEAVAMKKPIVAVKGAISTPDFNPGTHYCEALDLNNMFEESIKLFSNPKFAVQMSKEAYKFVERNFTWVHSYNALMNTLCKQEF